MRDFNPEELISVLFYLKSLFGTEVFAERGRIESLVRAFAPNLKNEADMLERISRRGIIEQILNNKDAEASVQKEVVSNALSSLVNEEKIKPNRAAYYLNVLATVLEWDVAEEIQEEATMNDSKNFDSKRYLREARDPAFLRGEKAYLSENYEEARSYFCEAYARANVLAGVHFGIMLFRGNGCTRDYEKAVSLFEEGMNKGCPLGADWLAYAYSQGKGVLYDEDKSRELFESYSDALEAMAEAGSVNAQYAYGSNLLYGRYGEEDDEAAYRWLEKAMNAGSIEAGVQIAKIYLKGCGKEKDVKKGVEILDSYDGCRNTMANFNIGKMYYFGDGKEQDPEKARKHFLIAGSQGNAAAQKHLGDMYYFGNGTEKNISEAFKWYEAAAKQGNVSASFSLGLMYSKGEGVNRNKDEAFRLFQYAADHGDAHAQYILYLYLKLDSDYKDYEKAVEYLQESANGNFAEAQRELGEACFGLGVRHKKDGNVQWSADCVKQAIEWLTKAFKQGDATALIDLLEISTAGYGKPLDKKELRSSLELIDLMLANDAIKGKSRADQHRRAAKLYDNAFDDRENLQKAYDHYCMAFAAGEKSVLYNLGLMFFFSGFKSSAFPVTADQLLKMIIEEENRSASSDLAYLLGNIYYRGGQMEINKPQAQKWYIKAMNKGSLSAACKLSVYYINDCKLYDRAIAILEDAYKKGSDEATYILGQCYLKGIGVNKNRNKARELLKVAAANGNKDAARELKKLWL